MTRPSPPARLPWMIGACLALAGCAAPAPASSPAPPAPPAPAPLPVSANSTTCLHVRLVLDCFELAPAPDAASAPR